MARVVDIDVTKNVVGLMRTTHTDDSFEDFIIQAGNNIEGLRYVENEEVKTVSGRITAVRCSCQKVTRVNVNSPVDYFANDVKIVDIVIDASSEYQSKIITIPAREIVEFAGVENVKSVHVLGHAIVDMDITYSDDTVEHQSLEVGDYLEDAVIMTKPGKPDITGNFKVAAFAYQAKANYPDITGVYLVGDTKEAGKHLVKFGDFIQFVEVPKVEIAVPNSLASIAAALNLADEVSVCLGVDVNIPLRDDGKIVTVMVNEGKTVDLDLSGHNLDVVAYAFYVNGGTLNITDSTGKGSINCSKANAAYPAVYVANGGTCNMLSGTIDTTHVDTSGGNVNWMYGVVCSGDGVFNMDGGEMIIGAAAGISITNGTASGEGAKFIIGGDSIITSKECAGVYLADNKEVVIKDNAVINGGIVARLGNITVKDNARVIAQTNKDVIVTPGVLACASGVEAVDAGILALTGMYNSALGNDFNISIEGNAMVSSSYGSAVEVALVNTRYDQKATVDVDSARNLRSNWKVWTHDDLAVQAMEAGKTLAPETNTTDLTITMAGKVVYPVVD